MKTTPIQRAQHMLATAQIAHLDRRRKEIRWLAAFGRLELTESDRRAFAAIEKPAVSPTLDR